MNILSLFDGMSCGQIALNRAGIEYDNYYASEIDKYAIKITQKNYPDTTQLGSVEDWPSWRLRNIDLIIGGSPCQGFSHAGEGLNFDDPRSKLFFDFVDIITSYEPKYWLLENVRMKKEWEETITELVGVEPVMIDFKLVSAQTRKRLYWANFPITQPEDKGQLLEDVIESGHVDREKSYCIDANYFKGGNLRSYIEKRRRQLVFDEKPKYYQSERRLMVQEGNSYRKLTPLECERLQTVPEGYTEEVSSTQRYKMLGNGWTVDVIAHIFEGIKNDINTIC